MVMDGRMPTTRQPDTEWPTRRVSFLVLPHVHLMNLGGPLDVFARASSLLLDGRRATSAYEIELLTTGDDALTTATGLTLLGGRPWHQASESIDTLIVVSGAEVFHRLPDSPVLEWLRGCAKNVRRIASVCAGAFVLAEAGILDGLRAATHWNAAARLARLYP